MRKVQGLSFRSLYTVEGSCVKGSRFRVQASEVWGLGIEV